MTTTALADEASRIAEDVADLISLAQDREDDADLARVVARVVERHTRPDGSGVPLSLAARMLKVSVPTVQLWTDRGILQWAAGRTRQVSSVSLGAALAAIRLLEKTGEGRERLLRALETLRDRDLLVRARLAADGAASNDSIIYDESALDELRRR